ncbi:hypothetical protein ANANG_G00146000 [Anguilla anguilla]|uniref:PDZ domain-containing protein n=1 Tax=Anguilla anguilla TaxID=7936 RepID=A0A9D3S0P3_ANGAN|nr:hypothetical protein ANANG_G00146000 [Anguilla anguilla]
MTHIQKGCTETPIEEFTPTPAFPALQYLESVDVEGVAWRAGLRTGDFLIEVNGVNVVKVGHKQVVSLIRQGGNHLLMKVVSVTRKPESEEVVRKKAPPPPKRAPSTTLTLRSKSMTAELEELASARRRRGERFDEMLASQEPVARAPVAEVDYRAATVKQRPTSRRITQAEISSLFERQGMVPHGGLHPGLDKTHMPLPKGMSRTKSFGASEEDRLSALVGEARFPRSSSMTDSLRDSHSILRLPRPRPSSPSPTTRTRPRPSARPLRRAGPRPGPLQLQARLGGQAARPGAAGGGGGGDLRPARAAAHAERQKKARSMIILQDSSHLPVEPTDLPRLGPSAAPPEKIKRKGRVIDNPYANVGQFSIGLYTPTKPQRKKSPLVKQLQVEDAQERARAEYYQQQLLQERARAQAEGPFSAVIAGAVRDRERRLQERRRSTVFLSVGTVEGGSSAHELSPSPRSPAPSTSGCSAGSWASCRRPPRPGARALPGGTTFIHPLTGRPLDPHSPLALALAARERALTPQSQSPWAAPRPGLSTRRRGRSATGPRARPRRGPLQEPVGSPAALRKELDPRAEGRKDDRKQEDKKSMIISIVDTSQQKTAGSSWSTRPATGRRRSWAWRRRRRRRRGRPPRPPKPALGELKRGRRRPGGGGGDGSGRPASGEPRGEEDAGAGQLGGGRGALHRHPPARAALLQRRGDARGAAQDRRGAAARRVRQRAPGQAGRPPPPPGPQLARLVAPAAQTQAAAAAAAAPPAGGTPSGKPSDAHLAPESAADSGVEEVDARSSSDHHLETTSTVSTVSSMSTLSSESGEPTDTYSSYADGQTFILDKPPVPPKPKLKSQLGKGPVTFRDPLLKQSSDSELLSQQHAAALAAAASAGRPRYLFQRRSKLWGDPVEPRLPPGPEDGKPTVIGELSSRLQQLNKDTRSLGEEPLGASLDPGRKSPVAGARLFSSLGELHTISQRSYGTTYTIRPGSRYPVTRRTPSPGRAPPDRTDPLGPIRGYGLAGSPTTPPTILKSSSLSIPHEPKEVRFVMRSSSARSRSPSPSPSPLGSPLLALRPFHQKPLHLWNKYDVGDWLESINLGSTGTASRTTRSRARTCPPSPRTTSPSWA